MPALRSGAAVVAAFVAGCGSQVVHTPDDSTDAGTSDDAFVVGPDATRPPGCPGDFFGPCSEDGKVCTYREYCTLPSFFVYDVTCRTPAGGGPLAWFITAERDCYRVNNADGCPLGGALDNTDCDRIGQVCTYPVQCAKKSDYQVARCVFGDTGFGVWTTIGTQRCGT